MQNTTLNLPDFTYLTHNIFESLEEKEEIQKRGANSPISSEAIALGKLHEKEIRAAYLPALSIRFLTSAVGHGAFLEEDLPKGAFVGEYTGIVRRNDIRRYSLNNYIYTYPVKDINNINYIIDASSGNLTRFINHSFNPNLAPHFAYLDGFYHLIFLTLTPLLAGTHLSYNYGQSYWYIRKWPEEI